MKVFWLRLYPKDPANGNEVEYLFTTRNHPQATTIEAGKTYLPFLENYPKLEISVFNGDFTGRGETKCDNLSISQGDVSLVVWPNLVWDGARAEIYKGFDNTTTWAGVTQVFSGLVDKAPDMNGDSVGISLTDPGDYLVKEFLTETYLGTGGAEGPIGLKGVLKPLALGKPKGCQPVLVNAANVVFQYSGYGETIGVQTLWENALSFGAKTATITYQGSITATYNALVAQALTVGQWADAPSIGMFRLGGEPAQGGVIVADVHGLKKAGGALISTLADCLDYLFATAGEGARVDATNLTALQTATGGMTISDYFLDQESIVEIVERYLRSVGGYYFYNTTGGVRFNLVRMTTPTYTLATDGRTEPVVEDLAVLPVSAPYKELKLGVDKNFRVHSTSEISDAILVLVDEVAIAALSAQEIATQAQNEVDIVETSMNRIGADGYIAKVEKQKVIVDKANLDNEETDILSRATGYGITTPKTNYSNALTALETYLAGLSPAWNDTTQDTAIVRATWTTKWTDVYLARALLLTEIAEYALAIDFANVTGNTRPADNAGTSGVLVPIGQYSQVHGNSVGKVGGTHGSYEGGAVGQPHAGTCFISSSLLSVLAGGGWYTFLCLDNDGTTFTHAAQKYSCLYVSAVGSGTLNLYEDGNYVTAVTVSSPTINSRMKLWYDGVNVKAQVDNGTILSVAAAAGQTLYPKIIDFYQSGLPGIIDIQYGPYSQNNFSDIGGSTRPEDGATKNLPRDVWITGIAYAKGDMYRWNGSGYIVHTAYTSSGGGPDASKHYLFVEQGVQGATGATGPAGLNVATVNLYKRAAAGSPPGRPSSNSTYTFATGVLADHNNGWTQAVPTADGNPLWHIQATASSTAATDTILGTSSGNVEWTVAVVLAQDGATGATGQTGQTGSTGQTGGTGATGAEGAKTAVVYMYQRLATQPAQPTGTMTYDFGTKALTGTPGNNWLTTIPTANGLPLWVVAATAQGTGTSDTIANTEWATAVKLAEDGTRQQLLYRRLWTAPATPTGDAPADWTAGIPTGSETLWTSTGTLTAAGTLVGSRSAPIMADPGGARAYAAGTAFLARQLSTHNGGTYNALVDTTGNAPTGTAQANAQWGVVAAPGAQGTPGTPPSGFNQTINLTSGAAVNLRTVADAAGYTGASNATITFNVPNGVTIRGLAGFPGGRGIDSGTWPTGSYTIALTIVVQSGGIVDGGGGSGGAGASGSSYPGAGVSGGAGGDAIYLQTPISGGITVSAGGTLRGGGAGGSGGAAGRPRTADWQGFGTAGGGGGGGAPNGAAGAAGLGMGQGYGDQTAGAAGTTGGGGGGGSGEGSLGGNGFVASGAGASGGGFGVSGYAVRKNGHAASVSGSYTGDAS